MIHELFTASLLTLTQSARTNIITLTAVNALVFTQEAGSNFKDVAVHQKLELTQRAEIRKSVTNLTAGSTLVFTQYTAPRVHILTAESFLSIYQQAEAFFTHEATNTLEFSQVATGYTSKPAISTLVITQTASRQLIRSITVTQEFDIGQGATGWTNDKQFIPLREIPPNAERVYDVNLRSFVDMPDGGLTFNSATGYYEGDGVVSNGIVEWPN